MQKPRFGASARMLVDSDISSLSAFVSALEASFAFSAQALNELFVSDVAYRDDEESHTYVLESS